MNAYLDSHLNVSLHLVSWTEKCPENKLSRVGVGGWLDQVGIKLYQLPTKLKLKLKLELSLAILIIEL